MSTGDCGGGGCECGCCCVHNKMEDIKPHPVMEQLPGVQYCINSPPPLRCSHSDLLFPDAHWLLRRVEKCRKLAKCVELGLPELILMVIISQASIVYLPHYAKAKIKRRVCDRYALLFSVAFVWGYAQILTSSGAYHNSSSATQASCRTDRAGLITGAPWLYIPYPFQWGRPTFQAGEAFAMMAASFVASLESTGTFLATARYGSATPVPASVVSRGVGWLGFGTLLSGLFGTVTGCTASVENAGLLAMTRFNDMVTVVFTSHATVAVLVAVILDCTLVREDDEGGQDSGSHWWEKFVFYNRDVRSHDFYKLPCKLNKLFPPV
ncbi:hypothetical protein C3L33_10843, partial [Rhododendron williamsianum]